MNHLCFAEHTCAHFVCDPLNLKKMGDWIPAAASAGVKMLNFSLKSMNFICCFLIYLVVYPKRISEADEYINASLLTPPVILATFSHILWIIL